MENKELEISQNNFMNNEIWMNVIGAAFQGSNVYKKKINKGKKSHFKFMLKGLMDNVILNNYKNGPVDDEEHVNNIYKIKEFSSNFSEIFNNGSINFGISQKILNLYLKYLWCLKKIDPPPHFPVDGIIQKELINATKDIISDNIKIEPWTKFNNEKHYLKIINLARKLSKTNPYINFKPAEIELELFNRRGVLNYND
tara:strand:+ start:610 stop:1203 length:594 start_codon:yes stop_codon:yes gene_type:complete